MTAFGSPQDSTAEIVRTNNILTRLATYLETLNYHAPDHGPTQKYVQFCLEQNSKAKKYVRIISAGMGGGSVHAFFSPQDGKIFKPAGWKGPVKYGAAYDLLNDASFAALLLAAAQPNAFAGGYLYAKHSPKTDIIG